MNEHPEFHIFENKIMSGILERFNTCDYKITIIALLIIMIFIGIIFTIGQVMIKQKYKRENANMRRRFYNIDE